MLYDKKQTKSKIRNKPTVRDLKQDLSLALASHETQSAKISHWLDVLNITNDKIIRTPKGKSKVQPKLAKKQNQWRYSVISEPFLSTDEIFKIQARGPLDRDAAREVGIVLNYQFNEQIDKVKFFDSIATNGADQGTAIVKVGWEHETKLVKKTKFEYQSRQPTEQEMQLLQEALSIYQSNPNQLLDYDPELVESVIQTTESMQTTGNPNYYVWAEIISTKEVEEEEKTLNQPYLEVCDYKNVIVDPTCGDSIQNAQFVIHSFDTNISALRKCGYYENLDKLNIEELNYAMDGQHDSKDESFNFKDDPRKKFTVYEYWGYWDMEGKGKTTAIVATWVNDIMIRCEENPYPHKKIPFVFIPYLPVTGSVYGITDIEFLEENQDLSGAIMRGMVDTFSSIAAGQKGIAKNALDATNEIKFNRGENFKYNPTIHPDAAIWQAQYKELPQSAFLMLQLLSSDAASLSGAQPFAQGSNTNDMAATAAGVNAVMTAQGKRELGILRRYSEGVKQIASMIMSCNGEWLDDEEIIRLTDESFVSIKRENLVGNFDTKLSISTQEMDSVKSQQLAFLLQTMAPTLPFEGTKILLEDIATLNRMPALAKSVRELQPPQPDPKIELEMAKLQLEIKKTELELAKVQAETMLTTEKARETASQTDLNNLEYLHKEKGIDHARDLEKQQAQAKGNVKRDVILNALKQKQGNSTNE